MSKQKLKAKIKILNSILEKDFLTTNDESIPLTGSTLLVFNKLKDRKSKLEKKL